MESNEHVWHREVINPQVERSLRDLQHSGCLIGATSPGAQVSRSISDTVAPMTLIFSVEIRLSRKR